MNIFSNIQQVNCPVILSFIRLVNNFCSYNPKAVARNETKTTSAHSRNLKINTIPTPDLTHIPHLHVYTMPRP